MTQSQRERLDDELGQRVGWFVVLRVVFVSVLLLATATIALNSPDVAGSPGIYLILAASVATYVSAALAGLLVKARRYLRAVAYLQIVLEVLVAASIAIATGCSESLFMFFFVLPAINGAVMLFRPGAITGAAVSMAAYIGMLAAESGGLLDIFRMNAATGAVPPPLAWSRALYLAAANGGAFLLVAALSIYLTEQIRRTGQRLTRSETRLASLSALHESIVRSIPSGVLTLAHDGRITFANRSAEMLLGRASQDLLGLPYGAACPASPPPSSLAKGVDFPFIDRNGRTHEFHAVAVPLKRSAEIEEGSLVILSDQTQLREMERQVARAERLAALGKLSAGLAHEVRNPLASVYSAVELLRGRVEDDSSKRLLGIALRETERLSSLITEFLDFARPASPTIETLDLSAFVRETADVVLHDPIFRERIVEVDVGSGIMASCSASMMKQVLWNLLTNAAQATPAGGRLGIRVAADRDAPTIEVWDNGVGIQPELLGRIFDPFFTTKERGTGMGLATVHRLVEAQGGTIFVDSRLGGPTRFFVKLPEQPAETATGNSEDANALKPAARPLTSIPADRV